MLREAILVAAEVVPWESDIGQWGVVLEYGDGRHVGYQVGTRLQAEADLERVLRQQPLRVVKSPSIQGPKR